MEISAQDGMALLIVGLALAYLARRAWAAAAGRSRGCGSCAGCPAAGDSPRGFVSVQELQPPRPRERNGASLPAPTDLPPRGSRLTRGGPRREPDPPR